MAYTISVEYIGKSPSQVYQIIADGPDWNMVYQSTFRAIEDIFRQRFASRTFAPKKRAFQYGDVPLERGTTWVGNYSTYVGNRLKPSLTAPSSQFGVRNIMQFSAEFGTSFPWAFLLHTGGMRARIRISPRDDTGMGGMGGMLPGMGMGMPMGVPGAHMPGLGMGGIMMCGRRPRRKQLRYRDDFGRWQKRWRTEDRGAFYPPRPFLDAPSSEELLTINTNVENMLNEWLRSNGMHGSFKVGV